MRRNLIYDGILKFYYLYELAEKKKTCMVLNGRSLKWRSTNQSSAITLNAGPIIVLPPFQIVDRFDKSRCIIFAMHLHKYYVYIHDKNYVSRFAKTTYNLERRE